MKLTSSPILLILTGPRGEDKMAYAREHIERLTGSLEYIDIWSIAHGLDPLRSPSLRTIREAIAGSIVLARTMVRRKKSFSIECHVVNRRVRMFIKLAQGSGYVVRMDAVMEGTVLHYFRPTEPVGEDDWEVTSKRAETTKESHT